MLIDMNESIKLFWFIKFTTINLWNCPTLESKIDFTSKTKDPSTHPTNEKTTTKSKVLQITNQ